ncbi:Endoribonuclease Dicer [Brachionus plicatilis]|uniref:Endoribonuclease Dicer n=1 Tax=Brachionus plicatilis TaxID=10195 RepID=A0A3M7SS48_BRAPC|nr:Endoribonuclease Dicer [Brachionus plicatilis]
MEDSSSEKNPRYKPRPYQLELFEKAMQRDIIIHARTGSGKTFISVMLINHLSNEIEKAYSEGGKRSIFLANTVPLVKQQAEFLRSQTHFEIGEYFGDKKIDNKLLDVWDAKIWKKELESKQVLVMTPKIFENMIDHCFIDLEKVNLIIFDECHHGTGKHPYKKKKEVDLNLKILGMTASIVNQKCSLDKFNRMMQKLEETYGCKIETSSIILNEEEGIKEQNKPKTLLTFYENSDTDYVHLKEYLLEIKKDLEYFDGEKEKKNKENKENAFNGEDRQMIFSSQNDNPYNSIKKECSDVQNVFEELGLWSFCKALREFNDRLVSTNYSAFEPSEKKKIDEFIKKFENLFEMVREIMSEEDEHNVEKIYQFSSEKLKKMLDIYLQQKENNQNFHSIIFVERKYMAYFMDMILKNLNQTETWSFIKSDFISSISGTKKNMTLTQQEKALRSFRKHEINILVATSIVEEGVDVPACNMVIRFSKIYNFGSYIQSKVCILTCIFEYKVMYNENMINIIDRIHQGLHSVFYKAFFTT